MAKLHRRDFLRFVASGAALAVFSRCVPASAVPDASPTPVLEFPLTPVPSTPTRAPEPVASPTAVPSPLPATMPTSLRNENRAGFYIRYYKAFEPIDLEKWVLSVTGKVRYSQRMTLKDIQALPVLKQTSRLKCVEGWSVAAKWEGFDPQVLVDMVEPQEEAGWVHFHCADGYYESLALGELVFDRVLFAYRMNDAMLPPEYGAPLRIIVPHKYGYKGPKAITRIVFADKELRGYWSTVGPYSTEGQIEPGVDYALDLQAYRQVSGRGEIVYADGIEAQDD